MRCQHHDAIRVTDPGVGSAQPVAGFLGARISLVEVMRHDDRRAGTLRQLLQFVHQVGDLAVGVFVPVTQDLVSRIEDD